MTNYAARADVQQRACALLRRALAADAGRAAEDVAAAGAIRAVTAALLAHAADASLQTDGLFVLGALTHGSAARVADAIFERAITAAVAAMSLHTDESVKAQACHALAGIASCHGADVRNEAAAAGALPAVVAALRVCVASESVALYGVCALDNLLQCGDAHAPPAANVPEAVVRVLQRHSANGMLQTYGCALLGRFAAASAEGALQAAAAGSIEAVIAALRAHGARSPDLQQNACGALLDLVRRSAASKARASGAGAIEVLLAVMRRDAAPADTAALACAAVASIAEEPAAAAHAGAVGAIEALAVVVRAQPDCTAVQEQCVRALAVLVQSSDASMRKAHVADVPGAVATALHTHGAASAQLSRAGARVLALAQQSAAAADASAAELMASEEAERAARLSGVAAASRSGARARLSGSSTASERLQTPAADAAAAAAEDEHASDAATQASSGAESDDASAWSGANRSSDVGDAAADDDTSAGWPSASLGVGNSSPEAQPVAAPAEVAASSSALQQPRYAASGARVLTFAAGVCAGAALALVSPYAAALAAALAPSLRLVACAVLAPRLTTAPPRTTKTCCACSADVLIDDLLLLLPCAHRCLCAGCAAHLLETPAGSRHCPKCRAPVSGTSRVYDA
jgi:hypothetical protein